MGLRKKFRALSLNENENANQISMSDGSSKRAMDPRQIGRPENLQVSRQFTIGICIEFLICADF
jgi:hypothetical protein